MHSQIVAAKKRLGQNFLHDPSVVRRIVASLDLAASDRLLEIGCGTGALTRHIASIPRQFIGVELDKALFRKLADQYSSASVLFLNEDILRLDISETVRNLDPAMGKLKVVGNLPYYISSPIIEWLGKQSGMIESATIMLQAEVAARLMASPGNREFGVLSLVAGYHFEMIKIMDVRPGAFRPVPKVSSAVVQLKPKTERPLKLEQESALFALVKQSFSQRRKTLWNCLKGSADKPGFEAVLAHLGHPSNCRAEVLSLEDFITLFKGLRFG